MGRTCKQTPENISAFLRTFAPLNIVAESVTTHGSGEGQQSFAKFNRLHDDNAAQWSVTCSVDVIVICAQERFDPDGHGNINSVRVDGVHLHNNNNKINDQTLKC